VFDLALVGRQIGDVAAVENTRPDVGRSKPAQIRNKVVFHNPLGPNNEKISPRRISKGHLFGRGDPVVDLGNIAEFEKGHGQALTAG
jgi:hypothetical protein